MVIMVFAHYFIKKGGSSEKISFNDLQVMPLILNVSFSTSIYNIKTQCQKKTKIKQSQKRLKKLMTTFKKAYQV